MGDGPMGSCPGALVGNLGKMCALLGGCPTAQAHPLLRPAWPLSRSDHYQGEQGQEVLSNNLENSISATADYHI
jgi:hypothetical protein